MPGSAFDRVADIYDQTRALPDSVMAAVLAAVGRVLSDCESVIDVGVGTGRFAGPLQSMGFRVAGVDVSRAMLGKASEKGLKALIIADAQRLPVRDEAFDAAMSVHLLHLVKDWRAVTRELGRVSRRKVISLVGRSEGPSVRSEYLRLRTQLGHPLKRFEAGEEGLRRLVRPARVLSVVRYRVETSADEDLTYFEKLGSSMTWDLDGKVHREIMARLREELGGKVLGRTRSLELAVWRPAQLRL